MLHAYFSCGTWIYYLLFSRDIFCNVVFTLFPYSEYEKLSLINWWKFFLIKRLWSLTLRKRGQEIFANKCHTWNPKFYSLFSSSYNSIPMDKCRSRRNSLPATLLKNELFDSYFSRIFISFQNNCFIQNFS